LLIESYVRNNGIQLCFTPDCFYFFMTGIHKKYTVPFTPDSFNNGVSNVYSVYDTLTGELKANGYTGRAFQIKEDNSKQFGLLFSPGPSPSLTPQEMAQRLLDAYYGMHEKDSMRDYPYLSTSFTGPYSGCEQIHQAFLDARELNDLIFFGVRNIVITKEYRDATARPCDISAIHANVRRLLSTVCAGTCQQALRQADYILLDLIAPSYSIDNFIAMFTHCHDMLSMLETVYPQHIRLTHRPFETFFTLEDYRRWLRDTLKTIFAQLSGVSRYSPTLLMALSYINRNYARELSLTQLSEYVYANASTLSSDFNNEVGMSLSEYVTGLRIKKAQELLRNTGLTVPEIAAQTGFSSAKYFREIFKRQTGLSPQTCRERSADT